VDRFDAQEIRLIRVLGIGAFGTVYQALVRQKTVAVKVLHVHDTDARVLEDFVNECEILRYNPFSMAQQLPNSAYLTK